MSENTKAKTPRRGRRRSTVISPPTEAEEKDSQPPVGNNQAVPQLPDSESTDHLEGPDEKATLGDRILWVRQNLPNIKKEKPNKLQYEVLTHEYVNAFLLPLLNRAGLIDWCDLVESQAIDTGKTQGNAANPVIHTRSLYRYHVAMASGFGHTLQFMTEGWGEDASDKGPGKAQTYAFKAGRVKLFSIAGGSENEEGRLPDVRGKGMEPLSPANMDLLLKTADDLFGSESDKALVALADHGAFMLKGELKALPDTMVGAAIELLERWKVSKDKEADDIIRNKEKP